MRIRLYTIHLLDHFLTAYYIFNAPKILQTLHIPLPHIWAFSIPVIGMLARALASLYMDKMLNNKFMYYSSLTYMIGSTFCALCFVLPATTSLITLVIGFMVLNVAVTWEKTLSMIFFTYHKKKSFNDLSTLGNTTMIALVIASAIKTTHHSHVFLFGLAMSAIAYLITPVSVELPFIPPRKKISVLSQHTIWRACLYGLSYSTYAIPYILMRHWVPQQLSSTQEIWLFSDTALLVLNMVFIYISGKAAYGYYKPRHVFTVPFILLILYPCAIQATIHGHIFMMTLLKSAIIATGSYFSVILPHYLWHDYDSDVYIGSTSMGQWLGETVYGKALTPLVLSLWQYTHNTPLILFVITIPAWLTIFDQITMRVKRQTN